MSIRIALAGNPNCGKTTLFNALTGSNQFVGNWPGVTVEKKEGKLKKSFGVSDSLDIRIMDLPGIYSLSPYTLEEVVARNYLINERPDVILNIIDGTNVERNLYLTTQLMELGIPMVVAVNMMDIVNKNGDTLNIDKLNKALGCEVVEISALKGTGIDTAVRRAVDMANTKVQSSNAVFDARVEEAISRIESKLNHVKEEQKRFFAIKLLERDEKINNILKSAPDSSKEIEALEKEFDDDTESIITNERYTYISGIIGDCYRKNKKENLTISDKIDKVVTNRWLALPIFAVIMWLVYYISVTTVGTYVTDWTNDGLFGDGWHLFGIGSRELDDATTEYAIENIFTDEVKEIVDRAAEAKVTGAEDIQDAIEEEDFGGFDEAYGMYGPALTDAGYDISEIVDEALEEVPDPSEYGVWIPGVPVLFERLLSVLKVEEGGVVWSLVIDGIVAGVGAVLGFVPQMLVLFAFLAFLESCGYMARVAFIMDRIFRKFGLSGKSFIPMLIGTGCGVPGIMASRTIENDRDRKMTIMTTTFIPCGAKLPIIALVSAALFNNASWVAPSAYFLGIGAIVISGIILKKTKMFSGDPAPFVMELPAYHWPTVGSVLRSMWERGSSFIKRAGTVILLSSIVIWFASAFGNTGDGFGFSPDMELADSVLGKIGNALKVVFVPLGFGRGEGGAIATVATVMGLVAKEEVVGVFGVLDFYGLTKLAGYAFLIFNLLCAPCFAAMGAIKREMNNGKWFWFAIGYQTIFAYIVAMCVYQIGAIFAYGTFGAGTIAGILLALVMVYLLVRPQKGK